MKPSIAALVFFAAAAGASFDASAEEARDWGVTFSIEADVRDDKILDTAGPWRLYQLALDRSFAESKHAVWESSLRLGFGSAFERSARSVDLLVGPTIAFNKVVGVSLRLGLGAQSRQQLHDEEELTRVSVLVEPTLVLRGSSRFTAHLGVTLRDSIYERVSPMGSGPVVQWSARNIQPALYVGAQLRF